MYHINHNSVKLLSLKIGLCPHASEGTFVPYIGAADLRTVSEACHSTYRWGVPNTRVSKPVGVPIYIRIEHISQAYGGGGVGWMLSFIIQEYLYIS